MGLRVFFSHLKKIQTLYSVESPFTAIIIKTHYHCFKWSLYQLCTFRDYILCPMYFGLDFEPFFHTNLLVSESLDQSLFQCLLSSH